MYNEVGVSPAHSPLLIHPWNPTTAATGFIHKNDNALNYKSWQVPRCDDYKMGGRIELWQRAELRVFYHYLYGITPSQRDNV